MFEDESKKRIKKWFVGLFEKTIAILGLLLIFAGIFIVGYQVYQYLRLGVWVGYSVTDVFRYINLHRILDPARWAWIWGIINKIPLSIFFIVVGAFILTASDDNRLRKHD